MPKNEDLCVWLNGKLVYPSKLPKPFYELFVNGKIHPLKVCA
jgi:hypothetical protein